VARETRFLGIETSCDETAAAVFTDDGRVLSSVVHSQHSVHARFGGVVPELAARAHLSRMIPVIDEALKSAGVRLADIGAIAVHHRPGLVGALVIGVSVAKMLSVALGVPLLGVSHLEGHVYASRMAAGKDIYPCVALVASGGHTVLFHAKGPLELLRIGTTRDDAAGEAFDKAAALLGLGFPGGPAIEKAALKGRPGVFHLPRPMIHEGLDFSFSGLKTAVAVAWRKVEDGISCSEQLFQAKANLAAELQAAIGDVLVAKCRRALEATGCSRLAVGGGVVANGLFRSRVSELVREGFEVIIPPLNLCTDNAAMAAVAVEAWRQGRFAPADLDAEPA
jgi:N6-L-threonylcarbamoyladenine synthase